VGEFVKFNLDTGASFSDEEFRTQATPAHA